jgi:hypothetical protein
MVASFGPRLEFLSTSPNSVVGPYLLSRKPSLKSLEDRRLVSGQSSAPMSSNPLQSLPTKLIRCAEEGIATEGDGLEDVRPALQPPDTPTVSSAQKCAPNPSERHQVHRHVAGFVASCTLLRPDSLSVRPHIPRRCLAQTQSRLPSRTRGAMRRSHRGR